ncbi:MAG: hypothetical protein DHS20C05_15290 [Hyphococcus sp.]|nr:MAG: hypothetical protein DHS20C05_15290 [Marinicaulis sp.]
MTDFSIIVEGIMGAACAIIGLSHIVRPDAWRKFFLVMADKGEAGAIENGMLTLPPALLIVFGHNVWSGPALLLTLYGYALLVKAAYIFLFPARSLASIELADKWQKSIYAAGGMLLMIAAASFYAFSLNVA